MTRRSGLKLESLESRETPSRTFTGSAFALSQTQFIAGTVFADANANGVRDAGEQGVNGVRVYADLNANGVRDAGEPSAVTASRYGFTVQDGEVVVTEKPGAYLFNAAVGRRLSSGTVRVELPAGAALTAPAPTFPARSVLPTFDIGLSGMTGTPPAAPPGSGAGGAILFAPPVSGTGSHASGSASVSGSLSASGSSSASVSAIASTGPNGTFASVTGSVSGNATAFGTAVASGPDGTITVVFVG